MTSTKTIEKLTTGFYVPPHVWGDREFGGHGPRVQMQVSLKIEADQRLVASCYMDAVETQSNYTRARGSTESTLYIAPEGVKMIRIVGDTSTTLVYTDTNHNEDIIHSDSGSELVNFARSVGDTQGEEAGTRTGFEAFLNPVEIEIEGEQYWQDCTTLIDKVTTGFMHPGNNGCSGAAGAALLDAYGIKGITPAELHDEIRRRGNIIAEASGAAPAGVFRDALKKYLPSIILNEGQQRAFDNIKSLVNNGIPVIILQAWGSRVVPDFYAPSWDMVGMNMKTDGLHWIVLKGIDYRSRTFVAIDNGSEKRLPFDYVRNTVHFNKEFFLDWIYGAAGVHSGTYMFVPFRP